MRGYVVEFTNTGWLLSAGMLLSLSFLPGWWMCGVDGRVGWAPPSYLKKCEDKMNESDESDEELGYTGEALWWLVL